MEKLLTVALEFAETRTEHRKMRDVGGDLVTAPYLANMLSKSTQNQWSRGQQLTLTEDHLSAGYLKPKTIKMVKISMLQKVVIHQKVKAESYSKQKDK